jgi:hypothetical protein
VVVRQRALAGAVREAPEARGGLLLLCRVIVQVGKQSREL